ncbi:hypothetical protein BpHYR1_025793 [Brachionus plicatilis]|uniref:Uncharacterized protein n=1 Tax=Brachionus plicatilis TaxID=10195 RepID=A0A3M7PDI8_BRAPC|nr:hypothetical protein BpHYR1_025793 [Brachionus plicatilis]
MLNSCLKNRYLAKQTLVYHANMIKLIEKGIGNKGNWFETQTFRINEKNIIIKWHLELMINSKNYLRFFISKYFNYQNKFNGIRGGALIARKTFVNVSC